MIINILASATIVFFLSTSVLGYLYKESLGDVGKLKSQTEQLQKNLTACNKDKELQDVSHKQDDTISTDTQSKIITLEEDKTTLLDKIAKLESKKCSTSKTNNNNKQEPVNENISKADIDDQLPDDLIKLLNNTN